MKIKASYHQERLWFIDQFESGNLYDSSPIYHNIPLILELEGLLDIDRLEQSFQQVIDRHEALRTRIITINNQPAQLIESTVDFKLQVLDPHSRNQQDTGIELALKIVKRPFLLDKELLIRASLLKLTDSTSLLVIGIHHIIADRVSLGILVRELFVHYEAYLSKKSPRLPGLSFHYADFSISQRELPGDVVESLLFYWKRQLCGGIQPLSLPTDSPRAPIHIFHEGRQSIELPPSLTGKIKNFSSQMGVSHFVLLLAAFKVLLHHYSGQNNIVVGTSTDNRTQPGTGYIFGPIANLLALRSKIISHSTFTNFLLNLRKTVDKAYKNKDIPFDRLVQDLNLNIDMSRTALFDILFQYEEKTIDIPTKDLKLKIKVVETNLGWGKYDLNLLVQGDRDSFSCFLVYNQDYYRESKISRLLEHYINVLKSIVDNPNQVIADISLLTARERQQLLTDWNRTRVRYPTGKNIRQLFEEQIEKIPHHTALIGQIPNSKFQIPNKEEPFGRILNAFGEMHLTYRELNKKSNRLAYLLIEKGVQPGTIVAIMVGRSLEMIIGILGILKAGAAYLPIDPDYPQERINYMLADSDANVLVTTSMWAKEADKARWYEGKKNLQIVFLDFSTLLPFYPSTLPSSHLDLSPVPTNTLSSPSTLTSTSACQVSPTNLAYIIYTSGTTGKPKGVMIDQKNVVRLFFNDCFQFDFGKKDVWTLFHSYCFDFSVWEMYGSLLNGGKLVIIPKAAALDTPAFLEVLKQQHVTVLNQTPSAFYNLIDEELKLPGNRLTLEYIIFGGEALKPAKLNKWKNRYPGTKMINMFGITETTVHVTYKEITREEIKFNISNIGRPIPTLCTYVLDNNHKLLPMGIIGEICVGGEGVGWGYLNRVELTAEKFIPSPFTHHSSPLYKSGDLGRIMETREIEYIGRMDHQVKIRGFRIELGEIENQLAAHDKISKAVVVVHEDASGTNCLSAYIVPDEDKTNPHPHRNRSLVSELKEYLSGRLPGYMIPSYFIRLEGFSLTPNGKIDRKSLPKPEESQPHLEKAYAAPRSKIEKEIARIWQEALRLEKIGIHDNFFDIGGNSLNIVRVKSQLSEVLGTDFPIMTLFRYTTVRALAQFFSREMMVGNDVAKTTRRSHKLKRGKNNKQQRYQKRKAGIHKTGVSPP